MKPEILKHIQDGKFFSVTFKKRTTDELRVMKSAKFGVKKYIAGGERAYDFESKGLLPVFDMEIKEYRCIPLEAIISLTIGGRTYAREELD